MGNNFNHDMCQSEYVHEEIVAKVKEQMPPNEILVDLSDIFKALGDPIRVSILKALSFSELCVCDIAMLVDMTPSAVSHQLRVLRAAKVVAHRKEGKNVFYRLDDKHIHTLLQQGLEHVKESYGYRTE